MIVEKIQISETAYLRTLVFEQENSDRPRPAILICPGGGYEHVSPRESDPIALAFAGIGYHTFVLKYTVKPVHKYGALKEASDAMCCIRENADRWGVDPDKIAVCGFSAGGHLAASLATKWQEEFLNADGKNKPNAAILSYPVISSDDKIWHRGSFVNLMGEGADFEEMSLDKCVTKNTPPTFLWHTVSDTCVPVENTLRFANALQENKIPFEMHIYPEGPHGLAVAPDIPHVATWIELCKQWLELQFGDATFK